MKYLKYISDTTSIDITYLTLLLKTIVIVIILNIIKK